MSSRKMSVAFIVIIVLTTLTTLSLGIFGVIRYQSDRDEQLLLLRDEVAVNADQLAAGLVLPMWNFDDRQIEKIIESSLKNRNIYGAAVEIAGKTYSRVRDAQWGITAGNGAIDANGFLVEERKITYANKSIGTVKVFATLKFANERLRQTFLSIISSVLFIDLILILSLYLLLWQTVLKPLKDVERYAVAVSSDRGTEWVIHGRQYHSELESLRTSIEKMVALLDARYAEIKDSEAALQKNREFLNNIVENIPAMIFVKEATELRYVSFNKAGEELTGFSREELLGKSDYDFFPKQEAAFFTDKDRETLLNKRLVEIPKETIHTRHKGKRTLHTKKIPVFDKAGKPQYLLGISEDITEQEQLYEQLRHSQKLEAVGQLAGGVAHEFNNILTVIIGYGHLVQENIKPDDPQKENINQILTSAEKAASLTRSLLAFNRKQPMQRKPAELNEKIMDVEKFLKKIIGEDIQLKTSLTGEPLCVYIDSGQIEQVLINLATNARDAMQNGGQLTVETTIQWIDDSFVQAHGYGTQGRFAVVMVSDTGRGMDEETKDKIFEPFFTTKEVGKGTGLGLAIVYGIIKQHNGFIDVYSEQGKGTSFKIYIPILEKEQAVEEETATQEYPIRGNETILLVEDEASVRILVEKILREYGYEVILAEDGQEAVEKFMANRERIKLIFMDMIMPRKSGKQAYDEIKRIAPGVKVLFSSGYSADFIQNRCELEERVDIIMKPTKPLELLRKIRDIIDR